MKLAPHSRCSGCSACHDICPRNAISMVPDDEGFLYPQIDETRCVACGRCAEACPSLHPGKSRTPLAVYAAKAKDDELRLKSSSGGVFSLLSWQVIARGGIVYGAGFDHDDWHVMHKSAENEEELADLRGSKYVQSDTRGVYAAIKDNLISGREVLFSGTPCQVAGLRTYLELQHVPTSKLLLVDVVCHAVPSPLVWRKYLAQRLAQAGSSAKIMRISFRNKGYGWKRFSLSLCFAEGKEYLRDLHADSFLRGFLSELYNRPSCHNCQCRELRGGSDLTIADYWRVHEKFPEMDDDRGTSLVLVNTEKGTDKWKTVSRECVSCISDFNYAVRINPALVRSCLPHLKRKKFFKGIGGSEFDRMIFELLKRPLWRRAASRIKRYLLGV